MKRSLVPKISIIIPVFNRASMLHKAIESVIQQKYDNIEIIVMDGGSQDGTVDVIRKYEKYIYYWESAYDGSAALAANKGIAKASGDLIALLMADDWYEPNTFEMIARAYRDYPQVEMISCGGRIVNILDQELKKFVREKDLQLSLYNICYATSAICCRFMSKAFYERIGLYQAFDKNGNHLLTNDKEFLLRALLMDVKNNVVSHLGYTYLAHSGSYSFAGKRAIALQHCQEHREMALKFLNNKSLKMRQKLFFKYWYHDQTIRLFIYHLISKQFKEGGRGIKEYLKQHHVVGLFLMVVTFMRIGLTRMKKGIRGIVPRTLL